MKFIGKGHLVAPNGTLLAGDMGRVSSLYHEIANVAVKNGTIVLASCGQGQEIKGCAGTSVAKNFAFDVHDSGMHGDRHDWCWRELLCFKIGRKRRAFDTERHSVGDTEALKKDSWRVR